MDPILPSRTDLERRRLESTVDQDLDTLSLASLITSTESTATADPHHDSLTSISSIEYPRAFGEGDTGRPDPSIHPTAYRPRDNFSRGLHGTPRAAHRQSSAASRVSNLADSPVSTAGHHVSAVTLGEGIYRTKRDAAWESGDEFDPERSLGRLVGELGKAMRLSPRPTSPFAVMSPPRSPRSPSPLSSLQHQQQHNLSLTLNRNDPLPSPPSSRSASGSGDEYAKHTQGSRRASSRAPLGETTRHNHEVATRVWGKFENLEKERRPASAPARAFDGDLTRMTGLLETPAKGGKFGSLDKNVNVGSEEPGASIPQALASLQARLRALETEASLSRRRVKELEDELDRAREEVHSARKNGDGRLKEAIQEKTALEDLTRSLRSHLARLTSQLEEQKALVASLKETESRLASARVDRSVSDELAALRREIERLSREIQRLGGIVEQGLETRRQAREERTVRMEHDATRVGQEAARHPERSIRTPNNELHRVAKDYERTVRLEHGEATRVHHDDDESQRVAKDYERNVRLEHGEATRIHHDDDELQRVAKDYERTVRLEHGEITRVHHDDDELQRVAKDVERRQRSASTVPPTPGPSKLRQGLHAAAADPVTLMPPSAAPASRIQRAPALTSPASDEEVATPAKSSRRVSGTKKQALKSSRKSRPLTHEEGPESPFPSIRAEDEEEFFAALDRPGSPMRRQEATSSRATRRSPLANDRDSVRPQTVLARVVQELEDDFKHYKAIYAELADQYKIMDAASAVTKRHVLAEHLKEVIDTIEQKADQIAALYNVLSVQDRAVRSGEIGGFAGVSKSVPDILRMVRETIGEEGMKRLEREGVGRRTTAEV
ncbi:hypothetical protein BD324DRAFT_651874 [Kockovaella imperatae]|uniref:Cep57 centrosome microtubule-binding domain-containing protein n=1 Tax=Kockovaella imperatae TaxID=4999 RepID=A0A1Y1UFX1_9TREE|nr:hypothetical protein BD324DRAFT_651874 [Kockovaella imperatae]ORX35965.1 hypothetical protein BD324DRAFT_651874 [Kockovaella imperatae]